MGDTTEINTSFLLLAAIMQPLLFFISLEYLGQIRAAFITAILILVLILFIIWMWTTGKNPLVCNEEE